MSKYEKSDVIILRVNGVDVEVEQEILKSIDYFKVLLFGKFLGSRNIQITALPKNVDVSLLLKDIFYNYWTNKNYGDIYTLYYTDAFLTYQICDYFGINDDWVRLKFEPILDRELSQMEKEIILYSLQSVELKDNKYKFNIFNMGAITTSAKIIELLFPGFVERVNIFRDMYKEYKVYLKPSKNMVDTITYDNLIRIIRGNEFSNDIYVHQRENTRQHMFQRLSENSKNIKQIISYNTYNRIILQNGFEINYVGKSKYSNNIFDMFAVDIEKNVSVTIEMNSLQSLVTSIIDTNKFTFHNDIMQEMREYLDKEFVLMSGNEQITRETLDSIERYMTLYNQTITHDISDYEKLKELLIEHRINMQNLYLIPREEYIGNIFYTTVIVEDYIDINTANYSNETYKNSITESINVIILSMIEEILNRYGLNYNKNGLKFQIVPADQLTDEIFDTPWIINEGDVDIDNNDIVNIEDDIQIASNVFSDSEMMRMTFVIELLLTDKNNVYDVYMNIISTSFERI